MTENKAHESYNSRKERQPISVPFVWEVKPGVPNKEWKPTDKPANIFKEFVPPVKLVASIPFEWEEKPGTPLPSFPIPRPSSASPPRETVFGDDDDYWSGAVGGNDDSCHRYEKGGILAPEIEAFWYESDDSFSSAPSLLANGLISTGEISSAVPVEETITKSPPSPASETESTSSYATGTTSLVGTAFLEKLFPLLSPELNSSEQVCRLEKCGVQNSEIYDTGLEPEGNHSMVIRKPQLTLGELIMMSRRRSYQRTTASQMQEHSMNMKFIDRTALGCCMFGVGRSIEGLHAKWKRQLQLL